MLSTKTKILVIGANGQVGHCLVQKLTDNVELFATDSSILDITQPQAVFDAVETFSPDVIINAAAYTSVDKAESEPELVRAVNVDGAKYVAQAAQSVGAALLHISTDYVFDGAKTTPYHEGDVTNPQSVYGSSKLDGEKAVMANCAKSIILRTAWVFGEHGNNFVKTMLRLGCERDELSIVSDQRGAPTYAGDIANTLITIAELIVSKPFVNYGVYHYSGEPYVSWYEFAKAIFAQAKQQSLLESIPVLKSIQTSDYPTPAKRPTNSCLDCSKIQQAFPVLTSDWQRALTLLKPFNNI